MKHPEFTKELNLSRRFKKAVFILVKIYNSLRTLHALAKLFTQNPTWMAYNNAIVNTETKAFQKPISASVMAILNIFRLLTKAFRHT